VRLQAHRRRRYSARWRRAAFDVNCSSKISKILWRQWRTRSYQRAGRNASAGRPVCHDERFSWRTARIPYKTPELFRNRSFTAALITSGIMRTKYKYGRHLSRHSADPANSVQSRKFARYLAEFFHHVPNAVVSARCEFFFFY